MQENLPIVLENGSDLFKSGFAGDDGPTSAFYSVAFENEGQVIVGDDVYSMMEPTTTIETPIQKGQIKNWEYMQKIWEISFTNDLKISTQDHQILISDSPLNPKENREKLTQIMLETFSFSSMYIELDSVLAIYSGGAHSGTNVDLGKDYCRVIQKIHQSKK